jgi:hypothetical protein
VQIEYSRRLAQLSGEERLRMGCSMFEAAKTLLLEGIRARTPGISTGALKRELFLVLYGEGMDAARRERILASLQPLWDRDAPARS